VRVGATMVMVHMCVAMLCMRRMLGHGLRRSVTARVRSRLLCRLVVRRMVETRWGVHFNLILHPRSKGKLRLRTQVQSQCSFFRDHGMQAQPLKIGNLASAADVGVETIRYYQRRRLLAQPARPARGQRVYPPSYVERLRFIKRAQALGFSLDEIAALLSLDSGTGHARAHALAARRLAEIEEKIADLAAMRDALADLIQRCEHTRGRVTCPIIATLVTGRVPPDKPGSAAPHRTRRSRVRTK
jgi:MerR family transcriptional regulator, mercuric resistance operon regulatory protein